MNMKKILTTVVAALLLMTMTVMGTLAYLTSTTGPVTNTFTVGNVKITLDELDVDVYGQKIPVTDENGDPVKDSDGNITYKTDRDMANAYKLVPNHEYIKDPTIHVDAASENCWVFVKVENGLTTADATAEAKGETTIAAQMAAKGWSLVTGTTNVFAHKDIHKAGDDVVVFEKFKIANDAVVADYANAQIVITGYAVQSDNFNTAQAAWDAAVDNKDINP